MNQRINYLYTVGYVFTACIGFFNCGYYFSHYNSLTKFMYKRYGIENKDLFNSLVTSLIPLGAMFGSLLGGVLAQHGRRMACLSSAIVTAVCCLWTTYLSIVSIVVGRFIIGMCIGVSIAVVPMLVSEISPKNISGPLGVINQLMSVTGLLLGQVLGLLVPYASSPETETTQIWKLIYIIPFFTASLEVFLLIAVFRFDTPKFYQMNQDMVNYQNSMKCLFYEREMIKEETELMGNCSQVVEQQQEETEVTWSQIFNSEYRPALIIGCLIAFFHQATGISSVTFYSNEIFSKGHEGDDAEFVARIGTIGTGIASLFGSLLTLVVSKRFGRKTILLAGEISMLILLGLLFNFTLKNQQMLTTIATILFVFSFNSSFGSILWLYCSEILSSKGCAVVGFVNLLWTIFFGCCANILFTMLTVPGLYLALFFGQIITVWFLYYCLHETKGKSKQDLKNLYNQRTIKVLLEDNELSLV